MFLIPTRNRPECMKELIEACVISGQVPDAAVLIDGDPEPYKGIRWPKNWTVGVADRHMEMIGATNELLRRNPGREWYGFLNDRARPVTDGWADKLVEASQGGWANCKSLGQNPRTGRVRMKDGVYSAKVVGALGWFFPPFLVHFFGDDVLEEVLQEAGKWVQTDVEIEEKPVAKLPRVFKGKPYWDDDRLAFAAWNRSAEKDELIERVRAC